MDGLRDFEVQGLYSLHQLQTRCQKMGLFMNTDPCHIDDDSECSDASGGEEIRVLDCRREGVCEVEYEVEEILDCAKEKGQLWFLVKWKDWEDTFNTWEPEKNLTHSRDMIALYFNKQKTSQKKFVISEARLRLLRLYNRKQIREFTKRVLREDDVATMLKFCGMTYTAFVNSRKSAKQLNKELRSLVESFLNKKKLDSNLAAVVCKTLVSNNGLQSELLDFAEKRSIVLDKLHQWASSINSLPGVCIPLEVENDIDLEGPPENFEYIIDYKAGNEIIIPDDPLVGCSCEDCYKEKKSCCVAQSSVEYAYSQHGFLKVPEGTPIYECNKRCLCREDCSNRVVQKGRKVKLSIFRTHDGRGWGVKTLEKIKRGQFVMEYVGEVITTEEADIRGELYDSEGRTYLFDLDFNADDHPYTVDAAHLGNVAHFMNHSCDPNLAVFTVWINNLDPRLPRIAFFARHDIRRGDELTFDYKMSVRPNDSTPHRAAVSPHRASTSRQSKDCLPSSSINSPHEDNSDITETERKQQTVDSVKRIPCKCGARKCRQYLY